MSTLTTTARPVSTRPARGPRPAAVRPAAAARVGRARPRLTRRGRLMVLLVLAALLFTAFSLGRAASQAASEAPVPTAQYEQTVVLPGDTLWAVARRLAPEHDPRDVVAQIRELNDLTTTQLQAGQQLLLPAAR